MTQSTIALLDGTDISTLAEALNDLDHPERVALLPHFSRRRQKRLFDALDGRHATIEDMVPQGKGPLQEVIHEGINTLVGFRMFQKRFCRPTDSPQHDGLLWGYNHQTFSDFTGPGYFVSHKVGEEFWIDYTKMPTERPKSWPKIIANEKKLGRFIYSGTVDKMRKLSDHVTIGRAYKGEKALPAWFVLIRKP